MCGIIGYVGSDDAVGVLVEGLKRLEYRGYDSWGVSVLDGKGLETHKQVGRIVGTEPVCHRLAGAPVGIAHTRWATHGGATEANAHPHLSGSRLAIVHNGIIENYRSLKAELQEEGYTFASETDSEVIAHLIHRFLQTDGGDLGQAVRGALMCLEGTFGLAVMSADHPGVLYGAKRGSPLVVGVGDGQMFIASDVSALIRHTQKVVYLDDNEVVEVRPEGFRTTGPGDVPVNKAVEEVAMDLKAIEKAGYETFMLKEIHEQPEAMRNAFRGRLYPDDATSKLGGLDISNDELKKVQHIKILGCGTSWHAGLVGKYLFEELAAIPTEVEYAAEFRYRNPVIPPHTAVLAISQSGETADTLAGVREAKLKGAKVFGLCNVVGSSIARECGSGTYIHAGPEIGVASTKAFTCQLMVLTLMALYMGRMKHISREQGLALLEGIEALPDLVEQVLKQDESIRDIAKLYKDKEHVLYIGRRYQYPVALEGALKLKEISYIHAEGLQAAELKHGPIALIDDNMPTVVLAPESTIFEKTRSNVQEIKARGGRIISVTTEGNRQLDDLSDHVIEVPAVPDLLMPMLTVIPLQVLAYHVARARGCDVDKPRNLAKSVTVE